MAIGDAVSTYAVDNTQDWPVIANTWCRRISVQENYNSSSAPTQDLLQKQPATSGAVNIAKGTPAIYSPVGRDHFSPGETVGTIRTVAGSITAQQIESLQV